MINLSRLKNKLEEKYTVGLREYSNISYLQCFLPTENNEHRIIAFGIKLEDDDIIFWDASLQKPSELTFKNENDLFQHIEDYFTP